MKPAWSMEQAPNSTVDTPATFVRLAASILTANTNKT